VSDKQCDQFQSTLDQAQAAANKIAEKYGTDSQQFQDAQRAIDAYGARGQDNGVTINIGATAGYPGTTMAGNTGQVTDDNPTGQNIQVTLNSGLFNGGSSDALTWTVGHEGSHVADAEQWADSGFTQAGNPTVMGTEFRAYGVTASIAEALGAKALTGTAPSWTHAPSTTFWRAGYLQPVNDALTRLLIKRNYTEGGGQK
jgi:ribosomal protein L21E